MHKVIKFISNFLYNKTMKEVVKLLQLVFLGQLHWYFLQYCRVGLCRGQGKLGVGIWCCSGRHGARKHCTLQWLLLLLTSCTSRQPIHLYCTSFCCCNWETNTSQSAHIRSFSVSWLPRWSTSREAGLASTNQPVSVRYTLQTFAWSPHHRYTKGLAVIHK